jgi:hypothetical protein
MAVPVLECNVHTITPTYIMAYALTKLVVCCLCVT